MATLRPLVVVDGRVKQLPLSDTLPGAGGGGSQEVYVQATRPTEPGPWIWWKLESGQITDITINDGA